VDVLVPQAAQASQVQFLKFPKGVPAVSAYVSDTGNSHIRGRRRRRRDRLTLLIATAAVLVAVITTTAFVLRRRTSTISTSRTTGSRSILNPIFGFMPRPSSSSTSTPAWCSGRGIRRRCARRRA
jgi:hypothetical protein